MQQNLVLGFCTNCQVFCWRPDGTNFYNNSELNERLGAESAQKLDVKTYDVDVASEFCVPSMLVRMVMS